MKKSKIKNKKPTAGNIMKLFGALKRKSKKKPQQIMAEIDEGYD